MKWIAVVFVTLLVGCSTAVPIKRNFPEAPSILMRDCGDLKSVPEDTTKLSDVLGTVTENYSQYHTCRYLLGRWQEWYQIQKNIFESAN